MSKFSTLLIICFLIMIALQSCTMKKYYYKEDDKEEKVIEEKSDSAAYMNAFQKFTISKKVHNDMKKSFGHTYVPEPLSFALLDNTHKQITSQISFANRDSLERACINKINELPNTIEVSAVKLREEKNGIGAKYDTGGLYLAPVKVLSAKFTSKEYSNYKDVSLSYKNISTKKITAIRFKWYGENAFHEPADMGTLQNGWGGGFSDDALRAGAKENGTWSILSKYGKKILIAYPYEVAFEDGTKWGLIK